MALACSVYGLGLRSDVAIAGLRGLRAPKAIDVSLHVGSMPPEATAWLEEPAQDFYVGEERDERGEPGVRVARLADSSWLRIAYADGTRVVIDANATRVWARGPDGATVEDTATYLLGPALGLVLRLRGVTCLHASAVAIGGGAVAFVGAAGAGKSSLAAAFAQSGHAVLTDDVAPLGDGGDSFTVQPAYPRLRLWPETAAALFGSADALPRITPTWDKRYLALDDARFRFQHEPLPLIAIYLLGARGLQGDAPHLEPMGARSALMSLVRETYTTRLLSPALRAKEFELLGRLVDRVPVRRLSASADLAHIAEARERIVRDVAELASARA